jgi:hypothetical protein
LLKRNLTAEHASQLRRTHPFEVIGGATGRRYRILHTSSFNVDLLNEPGLCVAYFCFRPRGDDLPVSDIMLAQKNAALPVNTVNPLNRWTGWERGGARVSPWPPEGKCAESWNCAVSAARTMSHKSGISEWRHAIINSKTNARAGSRTHYIAAR